MTTSNLQQTIDFIVSPDQSGMRFDALCAQEMSHFSRERIKQWILNGDIQLNGVQQKPKVKVQLEDHITGIATIKPELEDEGEDIPLSICFEDEHMLIIDKPVGLVVHPAVGNRNGTLVNALLWHYPEAKNLPRAGIVHRLDKDTSGVMMVAKTVAAHTHLVAMLQRREIKREYQAVVSALLAAGATIDEPIGRHHRDRLKMAIVSDGKEAVTHFTVAEKFRNNCLVDVTLETGRTHQIRVHLASRHASIVGDKTYGGPVRVAKDASPDCREFLQKFPRQALHAKKLTLQHPITDEEVSVTTDLPEDMQQLLTVLRQDLAEFE